MSFTRDFSIGSFPIGSDSSGAGATTQATTPAANLGSGRTVVVGVKWEAANGTCTVADTAGNIYTPLTKQRDATSEFSVQLFYVLSSTANASNIWTATLPVGSTFRNICAFVYSHTGTAAFVAESGAAPHTADANPISAAITAGDMAAIVVAEFAGTTSTASAGWTEEYDVSANGSHGFDRIDSPGGNYVPSCTIGTSTSWGIAAASFSDTPVSTPVIGPMYYPRKVFFPI